MKKQLKILVGFGALLVFSATPIFATSYLTVTVENANVRTGPGSKYPVTMELFKGYPLKVLKTQGDWYKVTDFEKDTGWIHKSIVKDRDTTIVNARKSLNMRSGPSTNNQVVADVERGVVLTVISKKGKWTKVRHSAGTVGWIYSQLLWP